MANDEAVECARIALWSPDAQSMMMFTCTRFYIWIFTPTLVLLMPFYEECSQQEAGSHHEV